ncbi:MAG TPA: hypothetical protein VGC41_04350, partial [Kofleriaceae bacterium]
GSGSAVIPTITTPTPDGSPERAGEPAHVPAPTGGSAAGSAAPPKPDPKPDIKAEAAKHGVLIGDNVTVGPGVVIGDSQPKGLPHQNHAADYDPKHFDGFAYAPKAFALAKALYPDVGFVEMDIRNVYPDGHADLTLSDDDASYLFRSPSRSARPTDVPANVSVDIACYVEVSAGPGGVLVRARADSSDENCRWPIRKLPSCNFASVWSQGVQAGAAKNTVAKISFLHDGKWFFDNEYEGKGVTTSFADRCP